MNINIKAAYHRSRIKIMEFDNQINEILMRYSDNNDNFYAFETIPEKKLINAYSTTKSLTMSVCMRC